MFWGILFLIISITAIVLILTNTIQIRDPLFKGVLLGIPIVGVIMSLISIYKSYLDKQDRRDDEEYWRRVSLRQFGDPMSKKYDPRSRMEYGVGLEDINIKSKVYPDSKKSI